MGAVFFIFLFPVIITVLIVMIAMLLTGIVTVLAGLFGGTAALFIKNKTIKYLLMVSFGIILSFGVFCIMPFAGAAAELSGSMVAAACAAAFISIIVLSVLGVRFSIAVSNRIGKITLFIVFGLAALAAFAISLVMLLFAVF